MTAPAETRRSQVPALFTAIENAKYGLPVLTKAEEVINGYNPDQWNAFLAAYQRFIEYRINNLVVTSTAIIALDQEEDEDAPENDLELFVHEHVYPLLANVGMDQIDALMVGIHLSVIE